MNPLTAVLAMLTTTVVTGPFLVAAFVLGHYDWPTILICLVLGLFGATALSSRIEHEIKRQDPAWDEHHDRPRLYSVVRPRANDDHERFDPRRHWRR